MGSEDQKLQTKNQTRRNDTDEHTNDLDTLSLSHSAPRQRRSLLVVCRNFGANTPQREVSAVSPIIRSCPTNPTPLPTTNPRSLFKKCAELNQTTSNREIQKH